MGLEDAPAPRSVESQPSIKSEPARDNFQEYRAPEKNIPHPQDQRQTIEESRIIEVNANYALHSDKKGDTEKGFQQIADTLKHMTPDERTRTLKQLDEFGKNLHDSGKREAGRNCLPDVIINKDADGNPTDITFKSLSDDKAYGKILQV